MQFVGAGTSLGKYVKQLLPTLTAIHGESAAHVALLDEHMVGYVVRFLEIFHRRFWRVQGETVFCG